MGFKAITIKDIARELNLSPSTVSKALHNSQEISVETRNAVRAFAAKHNYKPNSIAQNLQKGRSKSIGVVVCHIDNNFFSQVINGIESVAHSKDYHVIITQSHDSSERELLNIKHLASGTVDGLVISLSAGSDNIDYLKSLNENRLPIVLFDRVTDAIQTHTVTVNNYQGAFDATMHLVQQGYKQIAHITSSLSLSNTAERLIGYKDALLQAGLSFDESLVKYCEGGGMIVPEVTQAIGEILTSPLKPDAIFMGSDRLSTGTLNVLKKMNIDIPGQVALAGFTNSTAADIFNPPLTTVVQPALEMGKQAIEMLIQLIESKKPTAPFEKRILPTELIIRASSLKPKSPVSQADRISILG
jgi:LacI family transcriptional regulator